MKTIIFFTILFASSVAFSQLPNQNTYLLSNLDAHGSNYSACWGYKSPTGREYAILGCNTGTAFIDITDSANIHEVDFIAGLTSIWREMKTYSHYAYVVSEATNSSLQIVDLQYLPDSASLVNTWTYAGYTKTHSISQSGHYLYLNGGNSALNGGITIVDVANPVSPVKLGQWTSLYVHDCRILNDTVWAANIYTGQTSIINATNKNSPQTIRTWQSYPQSTVSTHNCAFSANRKYLYTTNELTSPNGKLNVWDINDLNSITFVREWTPTNIATAVVHNIETYGNVAILAHYRAGIRILDITAPANPVEVAWYDTSPSSNAAQESGCWGVYMFQSGKIIGSDMSNGLFVIKPSIVLPFNNKIRVNLKGFPEGFYNPSLNLLSRKDTVKTYLRNTVSPYAKVDSAFAVIDSVNFTGLFTFNNAQTGTYYIEADHFNSIRTWSRNGGEALDPFGFAYNYDFTTSSTQAYGNNLKLNGTKYCYLGGDADQNDIVDVSDLVFIFNDSGQLLGGLRLPTDLNGDNFVDVSDLTICYNNQLKGVIAPN